MSDMQAMQAEDLYNIKFKCTEVVSFTGQLSLSFVSAQDKKQNFIYLCESMDHFAEMPKKDPLKLAFQHNQSDQCHYETTSYEKVLLLFLGTCLILQVFQSDSHAVQIYEEKEKSFFSSLYYLYCLTMLFYFNKIQIFPQASVLNKTLIP